MSRATKREFFSVTQLRYSRRFNIALLALFFPLQAASSEPQKNDEFDNFFADETPPQNTENRPQIELKALRTGVAQSRNLLGQTAATIGFGLDSIFGSPDKHQPNESSIILRTGVRFEQNGDSVAVNGFNFRADLPSTTSKLQLFIRLDEENRLSSSNSTTSAEPDSKNNLDLTNVSQDASDRTPAAAPATESQQNSPASERFIKADKAGLFLRYIHQEPGSLWQNTFDIGWQLDTSNMDTEAVSYLRTGRNYQVSDWLLRPSPVIFWTEDSGPGAGINLHTQTELDAITTLNSTTGANYLFDDEMTYYQHGWQLVKAFSDDLRATYNITFYTTDDAEDLIDEAQISATLRRRIDGEWLFFSVTPADTLVAEDDYESNLSLTLQLEAKFGTQY
ncbi:hypothetical protein ABMA58_04520 [Oceanospirillum sp. HFRX-1_2]